MNNPKKRDKLPPNPTKNEVIMYEMAQELDKVMAAQNSFAMNIGAVARHLGISPKKFVKILYQEKKNQNFYMKVMHAEQLHMMKVNGKVQPWYKKIINYIKSYDKRKPENRERETNNTSSTTESRDRSKGINTTNPSNSSSAIT